ncbi:MAG: hypothetical protein LBV41_08450 [Cytophagaceae bacterium]|jgi:hypothetical protein|nr:hypothetical protein [Cytophagaceae bacterium]
MVVLNDNKILILAAEFSNHVRYKMNARLSIFVLILLFCPHIFMSGQKKTLLFLDNEPAMIRKGCFNYFDKTDSFTVVLISQPDINFYIEEIYPLGGVPKEFQIDNLYVLISGNILDCKKINFANECYLSTNMFELKTIKINDRGECSKCNDTTVVTVLKDEPAYLRKGCFAEEDLFYIELLNKPEINHYISEWIYPCKGVHERFRIDGLSVLVSGSILRCGKYNPCFPSNPNIRIAPINFFDLKTIKLTK